MILETDKEDLWFYIKKRLIGLKSTGLIPAEHVDVNTPFTTTSAVLVDITGMTVTITNTIACKFLLMITGDFNATGAGGATTVAYALNIDGVDADEQHIDFSVTDTDQTGALMHITGVIAAGSHTVKGRMRRVSGTQTAQFSQGTVSAVALQAVVAFTG